MKPQFRHTIALLATGATVAAQNNNNSLDDAPEPYGIRVRVAGKMQFNFKTSFKDTRPGLANTPGLFNDGYVLIGSNTQTNQAGAAQPGAVTWNWGYDNTASQVSGDTLTLTRYDNVARAGTLDGSGSSSAYGGEIWGMYELYQFRIWKKRMATWGFEAGYSFTTLDSSAAANVTGTATRSQGIYSLGGIVPPTGPYRGQFSGAPAGGGAAPVIDYAAIGSNFSQAASQNSFSGSVSSDIHSLKIGPWVDLPITDRFSIGLGAGYCTVLAQADFTFQETTTFSGPNAADFANAAQNLNVSASRHDWRPGLYASARLNYMFNQSWTVFGGVDVQSNSNLDFSAQGRGVKVNLGTVFGVTAGVQFSF